VPVSYPDLQLAAARSIGRTHRSNRLRKAGFGDRVAWALAVNHDTVEVRIAESAAEMVGWQIRVIA
jgi:hypothetical protein